MKINIHVNVKGVNIDSTHNLDELSININQEVSQEELTIVFNHIAKLPKLAGEYIKVLREASQ